MQDLYLIQNSTKETTTDRPSRNQTRLKPHAALSALRYDHSRPNLARLDRLRELLALAQASHPESAQPSIHQADGFSLKIFIKYFYECARVDFKRYCQAFKLALSWLVVSLNPSKPALTRHFQIASQYYWLNTGAYTRIMKKTDTTTNKFVAMDHGNSLR